MIAARIAFIYGSVAAGADTAASEIDIMIVGDLPYEADLPRRAAP